MNISRPIQQAPWRTRRQRIGAVLLVIVGISMLAALYLGVTSQATLIGREIQALEREISFAKEENANLKTELAGLMSYDSTKIRSTALGFRPATAEETHYLYIPGYEGSQTINLANDIHQNTNATLLSAEYTQSLFDWLAFKTRRGRSQ